MLDSCGLTHGMDARYSPCGLGYETGFCRLNAMVHVCSPYTCNAERYTLPSPRPAWARDEITPQKLQLTDGRDSVLGGGVVLTEAPGVLGVCEVGWFCYDVWEVRRATSTVTSPGLCPQLTPSSHVKRCWHMGHLVSPTGRVQVNIPSEACPLLCPS